MPYVLLLRLHKAIQSVSILDLDKTNFQVSFSL